MCVYEWMLTKNVFLCNSQRIHWRCGVEVEMILYEPSYPHVFRTTRPNNSGQIPQSSLGHGREIAEIISVRFPEENATSDNGRRSRGLRSATRTSTFRHRKKRINQFSGRVSLADSPYARRISNDEILILP